MSTLEQATHRSPWLDASAPARPRLEDNLRCEVAVLGGGIAGLTTALLLAERGRDVALIEAGQIGRGVSGNTTAKVTSQHGMAYRRLRDRFGADTAARYGEANQAALEWIAERVEQTGIDCDFRRRTAVLYARTASVAGTLADEAEAAVAAGLPATLGGGGELPFATAAALSFADQAEFDPYRYLLALAEQLRAAGGRAYEHTRAVQVDQDDRCYIKTPGGTVEADRVVIATHYPFADRSLAFARVHAERSYALLCELDGEAPPPGMYLGVDSPLRSLRAVPRDGTELLMVGGEGHPTGEGGDTADRYRRLERFAHTHWRVRRVTHRWSTQDAVTADGLPYVGPMAPLPDHILVATGFAKWGMTGGTAAALVLADLVDGRDHPWASMLTPNRLTLRASLPGLVSTGARTGVHFVTDRVLRRGTSLDDLAPGEGKIVRHDGERIAAHRRDDGTLTAVSPVCTHLGCEVRWNPGERSWDCPCHGSRFDPEGQVLHGPAVHALERTPLSDGP
jgi:glycine/D-amino acid oxidase-like deaminating enzyme/nitrite reductase/ring-hydroxylating ferredoxin subunit